MLLISQLQAYPMITDSMGKGKACVISVPYFEVPSLVDLSGYDVDKKRLCKLWDQIGFDVYIPSVPGGRCLTAQVSQVLLIKKL